MRYEDLEPASVFSYFKQLSDIPRGSGNEREAGLFILETARSLGHDAELDASGNVFVRAAATCVFNFCLRKRQRESDRSKNM